MFSVHQLQGEQGALKELRSVIVSKTLANNLAGNDVIGKIIRFDNRDDLMVTGVFEISCQLSLCRG